MAYLIGVDCGGTHIVGQTWQITGSTPVDEITGGPGNVVLDYQGALTNLTAVLDQLIATTPAADVELILIGIAGIETAGLTAKVQATLAARYPVPVRIISDAKLALLNGLAGNDGTLVISGTGSVVYGRQHGQFFRVGGWGYILGDEGSAYDIGKTALKRVLAATDAGQTSSLTSTLLTHLGVTDVSAAVKQFYDQDRKTNAKLALPVAQLAADGNREATTVLTSVAQALAQQIITLCERYAAPQPPRIVLSGSVLQHNPLVRSALITAVHQAQPALQFIDMHTNNAHAVVYWHKWASQGGALS